MYQSTRKKLHIQAPFAIMKGLSSEGGLFVPTYIPHLDLKTLLNDDYNTLAHKILINYFPEFSNSSLLMMIKNATSLFSHPLISPLNKVGDTFILELFHGPTLAFKDIALTLFPHLLKASNDYFSNEEEKIILVATSGDTGSATLAGFSSLKESKVIVMYPYQGISPFQEKQMLDYKNEFKHVIAINGNFDDCQRIIKELFTTYSFLTSANSINIARLLPQVVYYFSAYIQMVNNKEIICGEEINYCVPTGNFGNILAGYIAKKMGLPIHKLICATNQNRVLNEFFATGTYNIKRPFYVTNSPSMDIIISSNLERLLWFVGGEELVCSAMSDLEEKGSYTIDSKISENLKSFYGGSANIIETNEAIKTFFHKTNYIMDPHTAVAYKVAKDYQEQTKDLRPMIIVATASYKKFLNTIGPLLNIENNKDVSCQELNEKREIWDKSEVKDKFASLIKELKKC